jgi:hypothetical protein
VTTSRHGLCQRPYGLISASACSGPQLPGA